MGPHEPDYRLYIAASSPDGAGGGWAAVAVAGAARWEFSGSEPDASIDRLGLVALVAALTALPGPGTIRVVTRNQRIHDGVSAHLPRWHRNGWATASGRPVRNQALWQRVHELGSVWTIESSLGTAGVEATLVERARRLAHRAAAPPVLRVG